MATEIVQTTLWSCDRCPTKAEVPGKSGQLPKDWGLLQYLPPNTANDPVNCITYHLCENCFNTVMKPIRG